jgi:hypothetical protein
LSTVVSCTRVDTLEVLRPQRVLVLMSTRCAWDVCVYRLRISVLEGEPGTAGRGRGHGSNANTGPTKDAEGWELRALAIENEMEEQKQRAEVRLHTHEPLGQVKRRAPVSSGSVCACRILGPSEGVVQSKHWHH